MLMSGMESLQVGVWDPEDQVSSSPLVASLSDPTSLTGNVAAVFRGSMGRQCRTGVEVLDKGSAWIRSWIRELACLRCLFVTWAVGSRVT